MIAETKVSLIGRISAQVALFLLGIVQSKFVDKIKDTTVRDSVNLLFAPTKKSIEIFVDADPDDAAQLKEVWTGFVASQPAVDFTGAKLFELTGKVKEIEIVAGLRQLIPYVQQSMQILGDEVQPDAEQLKEIWKTALNNGSADHLLLELTRLGLARFIKDPALLDLIITLLDGALDQVEIGGKG